MPGSNAQGHVDMVTEKNSDVVHDFFKDPLRLCSDGTWLKARFCVRYTNTRRINSF